MEFPLLVNKEQKSLTITPLPSGEGHTACIDGREYRLRWVPLNDNEWLLDVDGHPIRAVLATRGAKPGFQSRGRPISSKSPAMTGGPGGGADRMINPGR